MDALDPVLRAAYARRRGQADHLSPSSREVELVALEVPLPQTIVRALGREGEALFASLDRLLLTRALGDVVPEQRHAADDRHDSDL